MNVTWNLQKEETNLERWRRTSLLGVLLGNIALLVDYFIISVPYIIMLPILFVSIILIFAGLVARKKQVKDEAQA